MAIQTLSNKNIGILVLGFHFLLLLLFHRFGYIGHYGFDDMQYAELAHQLSLGNLDLNDHFSFRITILGLTALSYTLFGITDFSSSLPTLLVTCSILVLIYQILKEKHWSILSFALSFTLLSPWFIQYSDKLMPDMYLAAAVFWSIFLYHRYVYLYKRQHKIKSAFWLAFSLLMGFCSKGTIILVLPWLGLLFFLDLKYKKDYSYWGYVAAFGLGLLLLYFLLIHFLTGDFAQRFEAIAANSYLNRCSYDQQSLSILLKRISLGLSGIFVREGLASAYIVVLAAVFVTPFKKFKELEESKHFFLLSALVLLLSSNFMSISLEHYLPMCLDARHYLFALPVAAIAGALYLQDFLSARKLNVPFFLLLLATILFAYLDGSDTYYKTYLTFFALAVVYALPKLKIPLFLAPIVLMFVIGWKTSGVIQYAQDVQYEKQREFIQTELFDKFPEADVISNEVQKRIGRYYLGFDDLNGIKWFSYKRFNATDLGEKPILLLENRHTRNLMFYEDSDLPFYVKYKQEKDVLLAENAQLGIRLYRLNKVLDPFTDGLELINSLNDFEKQYANWNQNEIHLSKGEANSGEKKILIPEYSATFVFSFDSIKTDYSSLFISAEAYVWTADATEASIVISIEKDGQAIHYRNKGINNYLGSYSNWWKIQLETLLKKEDIPPGAELKIYFYNPQQNQIFLDDFKVDLIGLD